MRRLDSHGTMTCMAGIARTTVALTALLLMVAGCGDDGDSLFTAPTSTTEVTTTTTTTADLITDTDGLLSLPEGVDSISQAQVDDFAYDLIVGLHDAGWPSFGADTDVVFLDTYLNRAALACNMADLGVPDSSEVAPGGPDDMAGLLIQAGLDPGEADRLATEGETVALDVGSRHLCPEQDLTG